MNSTTPDTATLILLRALFDLYEVDVRPTERLLGRLTGHPPRALSTQIARLRQAGLLATTHLGLSMAGLACAVSLPPFEPQRLRETAPLPSPCMESPASAAA